jgi:hypothetical protein
MLDCTPVSTPLDPSITLSKSMAPTSPEDIAYMKKVPYLNAALSTLPLELDLISAMLSQLSPDSTPILECSIGRLSSAFSGTLKAP